MTSVFFFFEKLTLFSCHVREKLLTLSQINAFNASFLKTTFCYIKVIVFFNLLFFSGLFTLILASVFQSSSADKFSITKLLAVLMR